MDIIDALAIGFFYRDKFAQEPFIDMTEARVFATAKMVIEHHARVASVTETGEMRKLEELLAEWRAKRSLPAASPAEAKEAGQCTQ